MTNALQIYTFIVCLIVYVLLVSLGTYIVVTIAKLTIRLIKSGAEDEKIITEYNEGSTKKKNTVLDKIVSIVLCILLLSVFAFSLYVNLSEESNFENVPTIRVVNSSSMAKKHPDNEYLRAKAHFE